MVLFLTCSTDNLVQMGKCTDFVWDFNMTQRQSILASATQTLCSVIEVLP